MNYKNTYKAYLFGLLLISSVNIAQPMAQLKRSSTFGITLPEGLNQEIFKTTQQIQTTLRYFSPKRVAFTALGFTAGYQGLKMLIEGLKKLFANDDPDNKKNSLTERKNNIRYTCAGFAILTLGSLTIFGANT